MTTETIRKETTMDQGIDGHLNILQAAEEVERARDRQLMADAQAYRSPKIAAAQKRIGELRRYFNSKALPFASRIEASPAGRDGLVSELLFNIRSQAQVPGNIAVAIQNAEAVTFDDLIRSGRQNWKAVLDCKLASLNPGAIEKSVDMLIGQVEDYVKGLAKSAELEAKRGIK